MTDDPLRLLRLVVASCEEAGVPYAVVGAVARNAWASPRATTDVDFAVSVSIERYEPLIAGLARRGVHLKRTITSDPKALIPDIVLLDADAGAVRHADLLVAKTPFEAEAVEQAVIEDIGVRCRVVRPEHLIVYKLIAGRSRDAADAEDVLHTCQLGGRTLDLELIRKWAAEWGVEDRLDQLLRSEGQL